MIGLRNTLRPVILLATMSFTLFVTPYGFAQDATPGATPSSLACDGPERPVVFIADILAKPKPEIVPTVVSELPTGQPVDEVTRSDVTRVVQALITCVNQGDFLRSFYFFEDEYLRRIIDPDGLMGSDVAVELGKTFATPAAVNEDDLSVLVEVLSVERLDDGTVVIVFRTRGGAGRDPDDEQVDLFVLRKFDAEWKIVDGLTDIESTR